MHPSERMDAAVPMDAKNAPTGTWKTAGEPCFPQRPHASSPSWKEDQTKASHTEFLTLPDALKDAGALYGPNDEQEFRRALPTMSKLASIFGAVPTITAVSFELRTDVQPPAPRNASLDWEVGLRVPSRDGKKKGTKYVAGFEPFAGKLVSIIRLEN
jgi:hypothetical protein